MAAVLFDNGITEEDELIPTLVAACTLTSPDELDALTRSERTYAGLELAKVVDGVPVLRVLPLVIEAEKHQDTQVLKQARIKILSRYVKPTTVHERYERLLTEEDARWAENNQGVISYSYAFVGGYLEIVVGTGAELNPLLVEGMGGNPLRYPAYHFPPPALVAGIYKNLLGSIQRAKGNGFAASLDLYGKPTGKTAEKVIPAFAAWHLGSRTGKGVPPEDRPRVAKLLNKHLLRLCSQQELREDYWAPDDTVWRDVRDLRMRFVRIYMSFTDFRRRSPS